MTMTFLVGVDSSEASEQAVEWAKGFLDPEFHEILVVSVMEPIPEDIRSEVSDTVDLDAMVENQTSNLVNETVHELQNAGFEAEGRTERGEPGEVLCRVADEWDADGVVLGRRGLGAVEEMLLGSVSRYVLHHCSRPVLIVPPATS